MLRIYALILTIASPLLTAAQEEPVITPAIKYERNGAAYQFSAQLPELVPLAGIAEDKKKRPFYEYLWEFGDGNYSREAAPSHVYTTGGPKVVRLHVVNNYAVGRPQPGQVVITPAQLADTPQNTEAIEGVLRLEAFQDAVPERQVCLILSYRNTNPQPLSGRLVLFFNEQERTFRQFIPHGTARLYDQELADHNWLNQGGMMGAFALSPENSKSLQEARSAYREHRVWQFNSLQENETRHIFLTLLPQTELLSHEGAEARLTAFLIPDGIAGGVRQFDLDLPIRKSYDPNKMTVSPQIMGFRNIEDKTIRYRVLFQNEGDGPADLVRLKVDLSSNLDPESLEVIDWSPECDTCSLSMNTNCLQVETKEDHLVFSFRGIALPGTQDPNLRRKKFSKGYIEYTLSIKENAKKRRLLSQTLIQMDYDSLETNKVRTRFRPGNSLGLRAGYSLAPDQELENRYFFGVTWSPYKSPGIYPQIEVTPGIQAQSEGTIIRNLYDGGQSFPITTAYEQSFTSFDLGASLFHDFGRFVRLGGGGVLHVQSLERTEYLDGVPVEFDESYVPNQNTPQYVFLNEPPPRETRTWPAAFAELGVGQVREGISAGARFVYPLEDGYEPYWNFFLQYRF